MRIAIRLTLMFVILALIGVIIGGAGSYVTARHVIENGITMQLKSIILLKENTYIISIAVFSLVLIISMGLIFSKNITKHIIRLRDEADKISKGNLAEPIEINTKDEIGELAESFDNMRYSLKMVIDEYEKMKGKEDMIKQLKEKTSQLERFARLSVGREEKMIELKRKIEEFEKQLKKGKRK